MSLKEIILNQESNDSLESYTMLPIVDLMNEKENEKTIIIKRIDIKFN